MSFSPRSIINLIVFTLVLAPYLCLAVLNNGDINFVPLNFDDIKNKLFDSENVINLTQFRYNLDSGYDDQACIEELTAIGTSLRNFEFWAIKLVDSWGKLPSGIFSGNFYEFGAFSQCFRLERNGRHYPTQYCMGNLEFKSKNFGRSQSLRNGPIELFSDMWRNDDEHNFAELRIPRPQTKVGMAINFGLCLPSVCSPKFISEKLNDTTELTSNNVTFGISETTCQFEENITSIETADWISIGLLVTVLGLMISSTSYDVWCTLNRKPKSSALLAFSVITNGRKLLSYEAPKSRDMMNCLHGIRVISTQWVVMGHTYVVYILLPIRNVSYYIEFTSKYENMFIMSALISVDTFFVMSGLLVSVNLLKHLEKTQGRINILTLYVHRYIRLTPLLVVSILFSTTLIRYLGSGPLWPNLIAMTKGQCERHYLSTLFYVQNYANPKDICFGHSWYLSVDTQLFLISPFVMYSIYKFKSKAVFALSFLVLGCIGCTIATFLVDNFGGMGLMDGNKMAKTYFPTHLRFSPWLIGVFGGYVLHNCRNETLLRIPKWINLLGWIISLAIMATVIFANYPLVQPTKNLPALDHALYESLSRVAWSIALCYIIFACVHNYGGPVNWFLSHPLWQPLSRLCYAIYLIHFPVVMLFQATIKTSPHFSETIAFHTFIGNFVVTVFISIFASLAFESPIIILEKLIFGRQSARREEQTPAEEVQIENEK